MTINTIKLDEAKKKYSKIDPSEKTIFVNIVAINELPDQYEAVISELIFNPAKPDECFSNVGSKDKPSWYIKPETAYAIANICGPISGTDHKIIEYIYDQVDILMKGIESEPTIRRIKVAVRVTKISMKFCEDGSWLPSSPRSDEFNFFTRACLDFINEEEYTEDYTKGKSEYYKYN